MKAEKGDLIRIVNAQLAGSAYANGDILKVSESMHGWDGVDTSIQDANGYPVHVFHSEYEIHRKAGEEDVPTVGDVISNINKLRNDVVHRGKSQDAVVQPNHYTQGKFETIEVIENLTSKYDDGFTAHCVGTAFKYMDRAPLKHDTPIECLRKAARYLDYAIAHEQRKFDGK